MTLASDKTQTKQINLSFIRKNMGPVLNGAGKQVDKKEKRAAKFKNKFLFLKTINFTVIIVIGSTEIPKRFVYISIGTIWENVHLSEISKPMGPTSIVIN